MKTKKNNASISKQGKNLFVYKQINWSPTHVYTRKLEGQLEGQRQMNIPQLPTTQYQMSPHPYKNKKSVKT